MQNTATEQKKYTNSTFYATISTFFVVLLLAFGAVFFVHEKKVRDQRELYKQYVAINAWRVPSQRAYNQMKPLLDSLTILDCSQEQDLTRMHELKRKLSKLHKVFDGVPRVTTSYAKRVERKSKHLLCCTTLLPLIWS
jgi:hypothetical protein